MPCLKQPKFVKRGEDLSWTLTVTRTSDGSRVNLDTELVVGATGIELEISTAVEVAPTVQLAVGTGITKLTQGGSTLGKATVVVTGAQNDVSPATLKYDVFITLLGGARKCIVPASDYVIEGVVNQP